jgi:hypothetical protein
MFRNLLVPFTLYLSISHQPVCLAPHDHYSSHIRCHAYAYPDPNSDLLYHTIHLLGFNIIIHQPSPSHSPHPTRLQNPRHDICLLRFHGESAEHIDQKTKYGSEPARSYVHVDCMNRALGTRSFLLCALQYLSDTGSPKSHNSQYPLSSASSGSRRSDLLKYSGNTQVPNMHAYDHPSNPFAIPPHPILVERLTSTSHLISPHPTHDAHPRL